MTVRSCSCFSFPDHSRGLGSCPGDLENTQDLAGLYMPTLSIPPFSYRGDPMNCNTPGLPVHHQLLEFTQTQVHHLRRQPCG